MDNQPNQTPIFFAILAFMAAIFMIAGAIGGGLEFSSNWWVILILIGIGALLVFIARSNIVQTLSATDIIPSNLRNTGLTVSGTEASTPTAAQSALAPPAKAERVEEAEPIPADPAPAADAPADPAPAADAPDERPDDLTLLEGIGPKMSQALIAQGYTSFVKLADASVDDIRAALDAEGQRFAPAAESWAEQASYAARGDLEGLQELQGRLVGGRYPDSAS